MSAPEKGKRLTTCAECDAQVDLDVNDGVCSGCGLDMGWCLEKARRDRAVERIKNPEPGKKTAKKFGEF